MKLRNKFRDYVSGQLSGHTDNFETSQNNIIASLRQGYSLADSIQKFGYDETKIKRWYNEGSKGIPDYYHFFMVCDSFAGDEIKEHDIDVVCNKLSEGKSFLSAIGDSNFKSDTYNSPDIIKNWIISGKKGNQEYLELYEVVKRYAFSDLLELDINSIILAINNNLTNLDFLDSDYLYTRKADFGRWYKNVDHSDAKYIKLNESSGDFLKRNSKDQFLYKLNKGFILGESFETDFHRFTDFISWYINGSKGDPSDALFYKNVRSILVRNNNFKESTLITDNLRPNVPFEQCKGDVSDIYVDEWIRLGKYGLEPFYSFYQKYLKHDTQFKVISYLKMGYDFNERIPDLNHDFETVKGWFEGRGEFYDICIRIFVVTYKFNEAKAFITNLPAGVPLNKAILMSESSRKNIEKWIELGKQGYSPFSKFYNSLLKAIVLKGLSKKLTFEETLNLFDYYYDYEDFQKAYDLDVDFQKKLTKLLVKNTNFMKSKKFLDGFNLEMPLEDNLSNFNITQDDLNQWISLADRLLKPFARFYDDYKKYITQSKVIETIKSGQSFEEAIKLENPYFKADEIKSWYDSGEGKFYEICYDLTEKESQNRVLSYLNEGMTFDEATNQEDLLHKDEDIKSWYSLGKNGDEKYAKFADDVGKTLLLSQLRRGLYLNNAIAASAGLIGMDYVKTKYKEDEEFRDEVNKLLVQNTFYQKYQEVLSYLDVPLPYYVIEWLNLAENGFDPFVPFYDQYKNKIKELQKVIIDALSRGLSIEEVLQLKNVNCSFDVIKSWYENGANNNAEYVDFYNAINDYKEKLSSIKENRDSNALDFNDKNKILATQNFIINGLSKGLSFEELINLEYLFFDAEIIKEWYFEGAMGKNYSNFFNVVYQHIKNSNSDFLVKTIVLLKMKSGLRFNELQNVHGFKSEFETIEKWYEEGLKGNSEHKAFAKVVQQCDFQVEGRRKLEEQKKKEAERARIERIKKQKEAEEKARIEMERKLEEEKKRKEEEKQRMIEEAQRKLEERKRRAQEIKEKQIAEEKERLKVKKRKEEAQRAEEEAKKAKVKEKEEKLRKEREEKLKRQRDNIQKSELVTELKN